jgi:TolB-like protein
MRYGFGDFELDGERFELRRGGARVQLQPKVLELLLYLARQEGRLVPKRELLDALWPAVTVGESSLTRVVSLARRAIGDRPGDGAILETVLGRGYRWRAGRGRGESAVADGRSPGRRAAVAVLPFADLSPSGDQEFLAEGLAEDLMLRLAGFRWFPVVARRSSLALRGRALDVKRTGRMLGARYLVEGSVQHEGDRVRVTAQLSDASLGHQLWASRMERQLRDLFSLQDELSEAIAAALEPELWQSESERAALGPAHNLDVWQAVQRGWWHLGRGREEDDARARDLCGRAVELDPHIARSLYGLAGSAGCDALLAWAESARGSPVAPNGETTPAAWLARAALHAAARRRDRMRDSLESAVRLDPGSALAYRWLGLLLGTADAQRSLPDPLARVRDHAVALAHFRCERYERAIAPTVEGSAEWILGFALRVAGTAHLGRVKLASSLLATELERRRELTFEGLPAFLALADRELVKRIEAGLGLAGWAD